MTPEPNKNEDCLYCMATCVTCSKPLCANQLRKGYCGKTGELEHLCHGHPKEAGNQGTAGWEEKLRNGMLYALKDVAKKQSADLFVIEMTDFIRTELAKEYQRGQQDQMEAERKTKN